jgi:hypothetical protein
MNIEKGGKFVPERERFPTLTAGPSSENCTPLSSVVVDHLGQKWKITGRRDISSMLYGCVLYVLEPEGWEGEGTNVRVYYE